MDGDGTVVDVDSREGVDVVGGEGSGGRGCRETVTSVELEDRVILSGWGWQIGQAQVLGCVKAPWVVV